MPPRELVETSRDYRLDRPRTSGGGTNNPIVAHRIVVTNPATFYQRNTITDLIEEGDFATARDKAVSLYGPLMDYTLDAVRQDDLGDDDDA